MQYSRLVVIRGVVHISLQSGTTLCHLDTAREHAGNDYAVSRGYGSHHHGTTLIRSVTCPGCLNQFDINRRSYRNKYYHSWSDTEAATVLQPIPASRPLPGRSALKGIHRVLFNARERVRRKSVSWMGRAMITQSRNSYSVKTTSVVPWGDAEHNAYMLGANHMLEEILSGFKLREFSEWRDEAYRDLAEFVHGELLDDEDIPDDS